MQPNYIDTSLKNKAIKLWQKGNLQSEISEKLGIPRSTLNGWLKNIKVEDYYQNILSEKLYTARKNKALKMLEVRKLNIEKRNTRIADEVNTLLNNLELDKDLKKLILAILYWCEGGKDISSGIKFINSDPIMIKMFLKLLRESFDIDENKFRVLIHLHEYHIEKNQINYWSKITQIPSKQFHKSYIKSNTGINKKLNYPGCISLRYHDINLGIYIQLLYTSFGNTL